VDDAPVLSATTNYPSGVYPDELVGEVITKDGRIFHVRPIRPSDAAALVAFHLTLSKGSVYRRYLSWHPELSASEVTRLTTVDYVERLALVVVKGAELVAVGRYDQYPGTDRAEVAFLVADALQRQGIGRQLLERLAGAAWRRGVTTFVAETEADNSDMLGVFTGSRFAVHRTFSDNVAFVRFSIAPETRTSESS
jgi:GNAT superfamily N-acetyltransferase